VERVPGTGINHEPRARDGLLVAAGREHVLIPQAMRVGASIMPSSPEKRSSIKPSNAARHTRAGTFSLSRTAVSKYAGGTGWASVLSWNSRTTGSTHGLGAENSEVSPVATLVTVASRCSP
jgi:hypothetical protein